MLVTGFEAYSKKRFLELEQEGIAPKNDAIIKDFYPKKEREAGIQQLLEEEASEAGVSLLQHIVSRNTINFQNYDNCKRAFNKGYGIKFGELGATNETLGSIQSYIRYRHKIVHTSPVIGFLNQEHVPPQEPVFSNKQTASHAAGCFSVFIDLLHNKTLSLRP